MNRPTRVLFLLPTLHGGGAERVVLTLLRHLDRERITATLAVLDGRNVAYRTEIPEDIEYLDLGTVRVRHSLGSIVRLIRRRRPDTVFCIVSHLNLALALLKPLLPRGTRLVARETNVLSEALRTHPRERLWRAGFRHLYGRFDAVICQSQTMRTELVSQFGLAAAKAVVIHNPVDVERIRRLAEERLPEALPWSENDINLVAAGRLSAEKGFDILIEALARLKDPRFRVTILGEGVLQPDLERLAEERGVRSRVHFAGFLANPYPVIARADAVVMSSRFEVFPNVVLEALACGTPVVATPAPGGIFEIAAGRSDCVLAGGLSSEELASTIGSFPFERHFLRRSDLSEYSVERISGEYLSVLAPVRVNR